MRLDRNKLRWARERLGYSHAAAGEAAGVSRNSVLRAEHEEDIRPVTARRLAEALGVSVEDIIKETDYPKGMGRPSHEAPESGDEGRRAAYLTIGLEEARRLAKDARWMRDVESYGESPQSLAAWWLRLEDHQRSVEATQERWNNRGFSPLSEQALPVWEKELLDQVNRELVKASNAIGEALFRFFHLYIPELAKARKEAVEQLLESARVPARSEAAQKA